MKKVLFATTALVASAGFAAADVDLSGSAEMGIIGGSGMETQFATDIDVNFKMSGTTDGGLTFGASIDLDESDGNGSCDTGTFDADSNGTVSGGELVAGLAACDANGGSAAFGKTGQGGETIFLKGDFGTITMGDTDGAFDWAMKEVDNGLAGALNDAHRGGGYQGNSGLDGTYDGQILSYSYSFDAFSFAVSAEMDDTGAGDPILGLGAKFAADLGASTINFGLGYQSANNVDVWGLSVDATFGTGFTAIANYSDNGTTDMFGLGLGYETGAWAFSANYNDNGAADGYGLAVNYDLGGGAVVKFGYGVNSTASTDSFSLGVAMSF